VSREESLSDAQTQEAERDIDDERRLDADREGRSARRVRRPISRSRWGNRLGYGEPMLQQLPRLEDIKLRGRQKRQLSRCAGCYGAPWTGGVLFCWLGDAQRLIDDDGAMRRADDDLRVGRIGRELRQRGERTRERVHGNHEGNRDQQKRPQPCAHPSHTSWIVFSVRERNGGAATVLKFRAS